MSGLVELQALRARVADLRAARVLAYAPYGRQLDFHAAGEGHRERLFLAGNRCGKTLCGSFEMACHLTGKYPAWWQGVQFSGPIQAWAASVTTEVTRDILQAVYLGDRKSGAPGFIAPADIVSTVMKRGVAEAVDVVRVRHVSGGVSTLGFKSYDQGREKFQGTARAVIHLDEEPPLEIYEECLVRTATVNGHVMLTMTPLLGLTPLVERFLTVDKDFKVSGCAVVRATWEDAAHLDTTEKARLRASLRPHELQARERGEPVLGVGRVFPVAEADILVPRFDIPAAWPRVFGLDFGWSNPTAAVWLAYDEDNDVVYVTDCYSKTEATPAEHAAEILRVNRAVGGEVRADIRGVCDPAGQSAGQADGVSLMAQYAAHGVDLTRANNAVESGLMTMLERMRAGKLKIFADMEDWLKEFRVYRRDRSGRIVKRHDHLLDATRYAVVSGLDLLAAPVAIPVLRRGVSDWRTV